MAESDNTIFCFPSNLEIVHGFMFGGMGAGDGDLGGDPAQANLHGSVAIVPEMANYLSVGLALALH